MADNKFFTRGFPTNVIETSDRGAVGMATFIQDQTTPVLTVPFLQTRAPVTLAADTAVEDRTITLVGGHGVVVGEVIELAKVGTGVFMQSKVLIVSTNVITLDMPVNAIYLTTDTALASSSSLLVNGSATPVVFSVLPGPTQSGDIVRIQLEMHGAVGGTMDFTTFGSETALANGCVIRVKKSDGTFRNLFNFKDNSDFIKEGFDHQFLDPRGGNTTPGLVSRLTWGGQSKHGVVIRLVGSLGEELQIVIQDNLLAGNTVFTLTAQGHELQGT
jgi:hypothetical protein